MLLFFLLVFSGINIFGCTGCTGGLGRGNLPFTGIGSGGGHGGKGGPGCYNSSCVAGGKAYGNVGFPCELGSGSGNDNSDAFIAGGGIIGKQCVSKKFKRSYFCFPL